MSSKDRDPMPTPYTTEDTGYPVGLYMPGTYYRPEYLAWISRRDPIPYQERHFDADEGIAPKPQRFFLYRDCNVCDGPFMPESAGQGTCVPCQREQVLVSANPSYQVQRRRGAA